MTVVPILCAHDLSYNDEEQEMQRTGGGGGGGKDGLNVDADDEKAGQ